MGNFAEDDLPTGVYKGSQTTYKIVGALVFYAPNLEAATFLTIWLAKVTFPC